MCSGGWGRRTRSWMMGLGQAAGCSMRYWRRTRSWLGRRKRTRRLFRSSGGRCSPSIGIWGTWAEQCPSSAPIHDNSLIIILPQISPSKDINSTRMFVQKSKGYLTVYESYHWKRNASVRLCIFCLSTVKWLFLLSVYPFRIPLITYATE